MVLEVDSMVLGPRGGVLQEVRQRECGELRQPERERRKGGREKSTGEGRGRESEGTGRGEEGALMASLCSLQVWPSESQSPGQKGVQVAVAVAPPSMLR